MNSKRSVRWLTLLCLTCLLTGQPAAAGPSEPCILYTKADAEALMKQKVSDGVSRQAMMPAGTACRYTFSGKGNTYSLQLRISDDAAIRAEGIHDSSADVMARQKNARKNSAHAAKKYKEIPDLGDEAFWNGDDLWLRTGETLLIITVKAPLEGNFPNREAMDKAGEEQNLNLSLQVAEVVLRRLK